MSGTEEPVKVEEPVVVETEEIVKEGVPVETKTEVETVKPEAADDSAPMEETVVEVEKPANGDESDKPKILKTKAVIDREDYRNNKKFDPRQLPPSDDPTAMRRQVCGASFDPRSCLIC